jgi:hypothetical protein
MVFHIATEELKSLIDCIGKVYSIVRSLFVFLNASSLRKPFRKKGELYCATIMRKSTMDSLVEVSQRLEANGLKVGHRHFADVCVYADEHSDKENNISVFEELGLIYAQNAQWGFRYDGNMSGCSSECVQQWFTTPDELCECVIRFFRDDPRVITEWIVPVHRHPEWTEEALRFTISHASFLSSDDWHLAAQRAGEQWKEYMARSPRPRERPQEVSWDEWFSCLFVPCEHVDANSGEVLWIRRDLRDAFRVKLCCQNCKQDTMVRTGWQSFRKSHAQHVCLTCHWTN